MKKLLVFMLALAMLLPMCGGILEVAAADPKDVETLFSADVEIEPFTAVVTEKVDETLYPAGNINDFATITTDVQDGHVVLISGAGKDATMEDHVAYLKAEMEARPEELRYLYVWAVARPFALAPEDVIYLDKGVDEAKLLLDAFFDAYAASGAPALKGVFTDLEYTHTGHWYIQNHLSTNPNVYSDIVNNPKYETEVRPLLEKFGFKFYENANDVTSEIYSMYPKSGDEYAVSREVWDTVARIRLNGYLNEMLFDKVNEHYPDALTGDYQCSDGYAWHKQVTDTGFKSLGGNSEHAGNTSTYPFYASRPTMETYVTPPTYLQPTYESGAFQMFKFNLNLAKNNAAATENGNYSPWITGYTKSWSIDPASSYANTPYYSELVLHFGMLTTKVFQVYAYRPEYESDRDYNTNMGVISQLLAELTRVAGAADRKPIHVPVNWNNSFMLSGSYAGGRNIWRITPATDDTFSLEDFKVEGSDPTFYIDGQTITFPQGKIVEDSKIDRVGTCGYWVETPTDVMPVITNDADRFEKYPSFQETFDNYNNGTKFYAGTAQLENSWEVTFQKDSNALVQGDSDKALALTGSIAMKNTSVPEKLVAGDSYAAQQTWQVTVTLPANMGGDAEVLLLGATGKKFAPVDNGLKIAGGKVYYDNAGEYVEMNGVDLSKGGTYTVKKVVDLRNAEALTCNYYIIDESGKTVGEATGVAMVGLTLPIQSINLSCANIGGEGVLIDDYKLYLAGVSHDIQMYEAETGRIILDDEKLDVDAAYRVTWANASDKEQTVSIVAAYYKGDKLVSQETIKELTMAPGADGVETGIAEHTKEGHSVVLTLYGETAGNTDGPKPSAPNKPNGSDKGGLDTNTLIIIGAAVVAAVVIFAAAYSPKKKAAPAAEAEEATEEVTEEATEEVTEEVTEEAAEENTEE